jgi:DNA-binding NtrC family response regulator
MYKWQGAEFDGGGTGARTRGNPVLGRPQICPAKRKGRVLIVDDETAVRESLDRWFNARGYTAHTAGTAGEALAIAFAGEFDIALVDIKLAGMDGMELQGRLKESDPGLTIITMTGYASIEAAVEALRCGAYDYITKPIDPDDLSHLVAHALENKRTLQKVARLRRHCEEAAIGTELIAKSPAMKPVTELIGMAAPAKASVLITGESGTGKEAVARAIHASGPHRFMPMVTIHCGALTETLLESELFGHEKGAFAGAQCRKKGKLETADGGTVFLDEISGMSMQTQTGLLRVLEENEIVRLGGHHPIPVDFRSIAATSRNLEDLVKAGSFHPDLYNRLQAFRIDVPPLRQRPEDVPLLFACILKKLCTITSRPVPQISAEALDLMVRHNWPGNVRELENAVERALVAGRGTHGEAEIKASDFSFLFPAGELSAGRTLDEVQRVHIERILRETEHNMSRAARVLDIDRTTLYNRLRRYGLR